MKGILLLTFYIYIKSFFFNVNGEDQQKKKTQKTKTKKQNSSTTKNNGNTKRCIDKEPCNAGFLITDKSLMHFKGLPFRWSQFSFLASSPCPNNDQFTKHMVMTEKSPQSPTSIRLTTILWWRQIAGGWRTLNSVYTLRKNSCLNQEANWDLIWGLFSSQYMCPASHKQTTFVHLSMMFDPRVKLWKLPCPRQHRHVHTNTSQFMKQVMFNFFLHKNKISSFSSKHDDVFSYSGNHTNDWNLTVEISVEIYVYTFKSSWNFVTRLSNSKISVTAFCETKRKSYL